MGPLLYSKSMENLNTNNWTVETLLALRNKIYSQFDEESRSYQADIPKLRELDSQIKEIDVKIEELKNARKS